VEKGCLWSGCKEMQEMEGFQKCWRRIRFIVLWDFNIQCDPNVALPADCRVNSKGAMRKVEVILVVGGALGAI